MQQFLSILFFCFIYHNLYSDAGDLDVSFSGDGLQVIDFGRGDEYGAALAIQADGKIVVNGYFTSPGDDVYVARLNTDGSLDATFDGDGRRIIDVGIQDLSRMVEIDAAQKIVIGFVTVNGGNTDFGILRLNSDGSNDNTFGTAGVTEVLVADAQRPFDMVIASSGLIYMAGHENNTTSPLYNYNLMEFNNSGSLTAGLDGDGRVQYDWTVGQNESAYGVGVQSDGKIIVYGALQGNTIGILRYNTNGTLDGTFGTAGLVNFAGPGVADAQWKGMEVLSDDRIAFVGASGGNCIIAVLTADGSLDPTFSTDGYDVFDVGGTETPESLVEDQDGRLVIAGYSDVNGDIDFFVTKYEMDGTIATEFGTNGYAFADFGGNDYASEVKIDASGDIFVVGQTNTGADIDFAVAKFLWQSPPYTPVSSAGSVSSFSAILNTNIEYDGGANITARGVVWSSTNTTPTLGSSEGSTSNGAGDGAFTATVSGLSPNTTYYLRTYATNSLGTSYGNVVTITTPEFTGDPDDEDSDGTSTAIENAAPNSGDGNGDGTPDSQQANVASLLQQDGVSYMTLEVSGCDSVLDVFTYQPGAVDGFSFPFGVVDFSAPCSEVTVKLYYHNATSLEGYTYRKQTAGGSWIEYEATEFGTTTIDGRPVAWAVFTIEDGGDGDSDGLLNGRIADPGGPAIPVSNIPVWDWWWAVLLIGGGWYAYRKSI